jgi:hypothetical protein
MYKKIYYTGFVAYLVMAVLAVLFFKERTILSDTAYNLFYIAKDGTLAIQSFRFGDAFTQLFAVAARNAGFSLQGIATCYSLSFIVYYAVCYALAGIVFRQYRLALVMLLTEVLFTTHAFYYEVSPLLQGIAYLLLALSAIAFARERQWKYTNVLAVPLIAFAVFFHPLLLVVVGYTLCYFWLRNGGGFSRRSLVLIAIVFGASMVLKSLIFRVAYEAHALGGLRNFYKLFPDYFTIYAHRRFLQNCISYYLFIPIALVCLLWSYRKQKNATTALFVLVAFVGYLLLVNICYPSTDIPEFYIENLYMPLALMLSLPLVFDVLPVLKPVTAIVLVGAVLVFAMARFFAMHYHYSERLAYERQIIDGYGNSKVIRRTTPNDRQVLQMLWGMPYEFWLLSTLETGNTASIVIDDNPHLRMWADKQGKSLVVNWNVFPYKDLPPRYFHFKDTVSGYHIE